MLRSGPPSKENWNDPPEVQELRYSLDIQLQETNAMQLLYFYNKLYVSFSSLNKHEGKLREKKKIEYINIKSAYLQKYIKSTYPNIKIGIVSLWSWHDTEIHRQEVWMSCISESSNISRNF